MQIATPIHATNPYGEQIPLPVQMFQDHCSLSGTVSHTWYIMFVFVANTKLMVGIAAMGPLHAA